MYSFLVGYELPLFYCVVLTEFVQAGGGLLDSVSPLITRSLCWHFSNCSSVFSCQCRGSLGSPSCPWTIAEMPLEMLLECGSGSCKNFLLAARTGWSSLSHENFYFSPNLSPNNSNFILRSHRGGDEPRHSMPLALWVSSFLRFLFDICHFPFLCLKGGNIVTEMSHRLKQSSLFSHSSTFDLTVATNGEPWFNYCRGSGKTCALFSKLQGANADFKDLTTWGFIIKWPDTH